jgi:hypothetical protein
LIRDYDGPTPETASELDANNPIVHLPTTTENDSAANPLAVELISMASVLNNLESSPEVCLVIIWSKFGPYTWRLQAMAFHPSNDPILFQQMFSPWDYPAPQSSAFVSLTIHVVETQRSIRTQFYDGQPAIEITENMLKLGAVEP